MSVDSRYPLCFFIQSFFLLDRVAFSGIFTIYTKRSAHAYIDTTVSINTFKVYSHSRDPWRWLEVVYNTVTHKIKYAILLLWDICFFFTG